MKKKTFFIIFLLCLGLVACTPKVETEVSTNAIEYIQNNDAGILEYNLNFSNLINENVEVEIAVDHYVNGKYIDTKAEFNIDNIKNDANTFNLSWIHTTVEGVEKLALLLNESVKEFQFTIEDKDGFGAFNTNIEEVETFELNKNYYLATLLLDLNQFQIPSFTDDKSLENLDKIHDAYVLRIRVYDR